MKKILIVVDMQNDFIDGALGTKEAVGIVDGVAAKIAGFDGRIFATVDTHHENYLETAEGKKLPVPHCISGTHGWLLHEKVLYALSDKDYKTVEKPTFGSTALVEELRWLREKEYFPETVISVDASCCAGVTPETHKAALETMKMCQIDIIGG